MASSRENVLSKPHASMLHGFCACNYIRLPLSRQHKTSVFASRFTPFRHFHYKIGYNAFALVKLFLLQKKIVAVYADFFEQFNQIVHCKSGFFFPCYIQDNLTFVHHNKAVTVFQSMLHIVGNHHCC